MIDISFTITTSSSVQRIQSFTRNKSLRIQYGIVNSFGKVHSIRLDLLRSRRETSSKVEVVDVAFISWKFEKFNKLREHAIMWLLPVCVVFFYARQWNQRAETSFEKLSCCVVPRDHFLLPLSPIKDSRNQNFFFMCGYNLLEPWPEQECIGTLYAATTGFIFRHF